MPSRWSRAQFIAFRAACALVVLPIHLTSFASQYLYLDGVKRAADAVLQPIADVDGNTMMDAGAFVMRAGFAFVFVVLRLNRGAGRVTLGDSGTTP